MRAAALPGSAPAALSYHLTASLNRPSSTRRHPIPRSGRASPRRALAACLCALPYASSASAVLPRRERAWPLHSWIHGAPPSPPAPPACPSHTARAASAALRASSRMPHASITAASTSHAVAAYLGLSSRTSIITDHTSRSVSEASNLSTPSVWTRSCRRFSERPRGRPSLRRHLARAGSPWPSASSHIFLTLWYPRPDATRRDTLTRTGPLIPLTLTTLLPAPPSASRRSSRTSLKNCSRAVTACVTMAVFTTGSRDPALLFSCAILMKTPSMLACTMAEVIGYLGMPPPPLPLLSRFPRNKSRRTQPLFKSLGHANLLRPRRRRGPAAGRSFRPRRLMRS